MELEKIKELKEKEIKLQACRGGDAETVKQTTGKKAIKEQIKVTVEYKGEMSERDGGGG